MAPTAGKPKAAVYPGRVTLYTLFLTCSAGCGGLLFGYDIGAVEAVTADPDFQNKFFSGANQNEVFYCQYNRRSFQLFVSSFFFAGACSALVASFVTRRWGRKATMVSSCLLYLCGVILSASANGKALLYVGRVFSGIGVGFANQAVPIYMIEVPPARWRGGFSNLFQLAITLGILIAQCVSFAVCTLPYGWRLTYAIAAAPTLLFLMLSILLPDSPSSLSARGYADEAAQLLQRLRGTRRTEAELHDIVKAASIAAKGSQWQILSKAHAPELVQVLANGIFQQLTGVDGLFFYVSFIFLSFDWSNNQRNSGLYSAVVIGSVNVLATFVSILLVDRLGRRLLLLGGGVMFAICSCIISALLGTSFVGETTRVSSSTAAAILALTCLLISLFALSWGPIPWLVPIELSPLHVRPAAQGIFVFVNFLATAGVLLTFLPLLCLLRWGVFLLYALLTTIGVLYAVVLLPETMGVPLERMQQVWGTHWLWRRWPGNGLASSNEDLLDGVGGIDKGMDGGRVGKGGRVVQPSVTMQGRVEREQKGSQSEIKVVVGSRHGLRRCD